MIKANTLDRQPHRGVIATASLVAARPQPARAAETADSLVVMREQMAQAVAGGEAETVNALAKVIISFARTEIEKEGPNPRLRDWQALVLDAAAAARAIVPAAAQDLARTADAVRHAVLLAADNPPDRLASRPTSRRVLLAIQQLGGVLCLQSRVRELADQSQTHFSNSLKILRAAGLVVSENDGIDGRGRRLSLTTEGRAALAAYGESQAELRHISPLNVVVRDVRRQDPPVPMVTRRPENHPHFRTQIEVKEPELQP